VRCVRKVAGSPPWRGAYGAGPGSGIGRGLRRFAPEPAAGWGLRTACGRLDQAGRL